jgi:TPR repeat protein
VGQPSRRAAVKLGVAACTVIGLGACVDAIARATPKGRCPERRLEEITDLCCPAVMTEPPLPEGCADAATCTRACEGGDAIACLRGGDMFENAPLDKGRDRAQSLILFGRGCRLGNCRACWRSAFKYRGDYAGLRDLESALKRDEADCKAGDPNSCRKVASIHREDGRYAMFDQRACDLGSAPACVALSRAYSYPIVASAPTLGLDMTPSTPRKLQERACELGHVGSCASVVTWAGGPRPIEGLTGERLVAAQWKLASDKLDPFCRRGEATACLALGKLRTELDARAPVKPAGWDPMLSFRYLDHACTLGDGEAARRALRGRPARRQGGPRDFLHSQLLAWLRGAQPADTRSQARPASDRPGLRARRARVQGQHLP